MNVKLTTAAALLVLTAACGSDTGAAAPSDTGASRSAETPAQSPSQAGAAAADIPNVEAEQVFLRFVREDFPDLAGAPDEAILKLGREICTSVEVDSPVEQTLRVLKTLLNQGYDGQHAGMLMGYATALCPEKQAALSVG